MNLQVKLRIVDMKDVAGHGVTSVWLRECAKT